MRAAPRACSAGAPSINPAGIEALANAPFLIDGKAVSAGVLAAVKAEAEALKGSVTPGLAVVLVGSDPASQVYVGAKGRAAKECGFHSLQFDLPETTPEADLLKLVQDLNNDPQNSWHTCAIAIAKAHGFDAGAGSGRSGEGRRRFSPR